MELNFYFSECHSHKKEKPHFEFSIGAAQLKNKRSSKMNISITTEQKVNVKIVPVTSTGKPAKLDGKPTWTKLSPQDPDGATLVVAADGLSAFLVSSDVIGDTVFQVDADADLGAGVETISAQITLSVVDAQASSLGLTADSPIPK